MKYFFKRTIPALVSSDGTASPEFKKARDRLKAVGISLKVIECDQAEPVVVYDRGDLLSGRRLDLFLDYAEELHRENPDLEVA